MSHAEPIIEDCTCTVKQTCKQCDVCEYCGSRFSLPNARPNHCNDDCWLRDKGQGLINQVESQSQFCNNCYRHVRDIEPIPESKKAGKGYSMDGLQSPTPNTTIGIDDFASQPYDRLERTRWSCGACGAVNPDSGPIAELQQIEPIQIRANLWAALAWLAIRDAIPRKPDRGAYMKALDEHPHDAAYACGKAVYADV